MPTPLANSHTGPLAPAWGWREPGSGRASHVAPGMEYQGTTTQLCGLYPYQAGSGSPTLGVPIGRHMLWGEVVCLDPLEWQREGLITNPGVFILGQPGVGKSAIVKRLISGAVAYGTHVMILGDTKPDYTRLVEYLGGQVIRVGRGMDRINPLDAGPMSTALARMTGTDAQQLRLEIRGRRMSLLLALSALVRGTAVTNTEEVVLGRAIDVLTDRLDVDPTVPDVLRLIETGSDELRQAARARGDGEYRRRVDELVSTLALLCEGSLRGVFDAPTSRPIDLDAPAVSVDISHVAAAGDQLVAAAMLSVWAYGYSVVDAATVLADQGLAPRRQYLGVMDELWRALRGSSGLVEHADALTRLNRARGMASIMVTHSLADLDALPTAEDRAKANGFVERSAIKILAGLPPRELDRVGDVIKLSGPERDLVTSWAAPEAWLPGAVHPGRGKYLIKTGERPGLPVAMTLVGDEHDLYDTDQKIRPDSGWIERNSGGVAL
jgi:TraG P-loop domain